MSIISIAVRLLFWSMHYLCAVFVGALVIAISFPVLMHIQYGFPHVASRENNLMGKIISVIESILWFGPTAAMVSSYYAIIYGIVPAFILIFAFDRKEIKISIRPYILSGLLLGIVGAMLSKYVRDIIFEQPITIVSPILAGALGGLTMGLLRRRFP